MEISNTKNIVLSGGFDNIKLVDLCFLEKASLLGSSLTVLLWSDEFIKKSTQCEPKFPLVERLYFLNAISYVNSVIVIDDIDDINDIKPLKIDIWADYEFETNKKFANDAISRNISYCTFKENDLKICNKLQPNLRLFSLKSSRKKVVVTGCYDWFHSGHIRFFEEASTYGDLYVIVGSDANIKLLKGDTHPLIPENERYYFVQSIKFVKYALISSGSGWLDADPEIQRIKPDIYIVNEDGDKGGKRDYCLKNKIEYIVLKREPSIGLPMRSSTDLRGF